MISSNMKTTNKNSTNLAELAETHNMARSIKRLQGAPYDGMRWRRALHHAVAMTCGRAEQEKIRIALELP